MLPLCALISHVNRPELLENRRAVERQMDVWARQRGSCVLGSRKEVTMKLNRLLLIPVLVIAGMWIPSLAQKAPDKCSNHLIAGAYSFDCSGTVLPPNAPEGTPPLPIAMLGVAFGDEGGNWHGFDTLSFNGTFIPQYVTTDPNLGGVPAVVHGDCSGTIKYQVYTANPNTTSDAVHLGDLPINFVVMNNGNEIKGLPTVQGYTVVCRLIRQRSSD